MLSLPSSYNQHPSREWEMEPLLQWAADILWELYDKKDDKTPHHWPLTNSKQGFDYLQWTTFTVDTTEFLSVIKSKSLMISLKKKKVRQSDAIK